MDKRYIVPMVPAWLLVGVFSAMSYTSSSSAAEEEFFFPSEEKAQAFARQKSSSSIEATVKPTEKIAPRYVVVVQGFRQWSDALKTAQTLGKRGFNNTSVVKNRAAGGYHVQVTNYLSKQSAGTIFNQLRGMGINNVAVITDNIKVKQYLVTLVKKAEPVEVVQKPVAEKIPAGEKKVVVKAVPVKPVPVKTAPVKTVPVTSAIDEKIVAAVPETTSETTPATTSETMDEETEMVLTPDIEGSSGSEEMLLVMSDAQDVTYEISSDLLSETDVTASPIDAGVDKVVLEEDLFTHSRSPATHTEYLNAQGHINWKLSDAWAAQIAARVDAYHQSGSQGTDESETDWDYGDSFIRYRNDWARITVGAQTIRWGRVDDFAPTDKMATLDYTRGVLNRWDERYRANPALRGEFFIDTGKLDIAYLPEFRPAELPDEDNVWSPVNPNTGNMLGVEPNIVTSTLLKQGRIDDDVDGDGGFGLRYSNKVDALDYAVTVQEVRLSTPYYAMNPNLRADLLINPYATLAQVPSYQYAFKEVHPRTWVVGGDVSTQWKGMTWRAEAAWLSDLPATTQTLEYKTYEGFEWAGGVEFYPGDKDTRVNLQLSGKHIDQKQKIIDQDNIVTVSGEVESLFSNNRWKYTTRFNVGLDEESVYVSPELSWIGWEPFEIYAGYHFLEGNDQTFGGFYDDNDMITLGWRGQF